MKRKEENRSVIEPSCTFFKPNKINFLPSNRVLDRKPDRVTGYKVLIDLTSLVKSIAQLQAMGCFTFLLTYELCSLLKMHVTKMQNSNKSCTKCSVEQPLTFFTSISFLTNYGNHENIKNDFNLLFLRNTSYRKGMILFPYWE